MRKNLFLFFSYLTVFLCYFWQFPRNSSFPGNCDTFFAIAYSNSYLNLLKVFFLKEVIGTSMFPTSQYLGFGETSFGCSIFFIFFKYFLKNDLYSYYFSCVLIFTLTSFFFAKFCSTYLKKNSTIFFAGLIFSFSNFTLGNIDSLHTVFFGITFASLYYYRQFILTDRMSYLYYSFILAAIQAYFSVYVFLFNIIILGIFSIKSFKKNHVFPLSLFLILASPHFLFYFSNIKNKDFINPWNPNYISELHSLDFTDLFRKIPGNFYNKKGDLAALSEVTKKFDKLRQQGYLKYSTPLNPQIDSHLSESLQSGLGKYKTYADSIVNYPFVRRSAFPGILLVLLSCWGFKITDKRTRWQLGSIFVTGFFLSMGPFNTIGNLILPTPIYPFYEYFDFVNFFRIPSRAYFLSLISMIILASICIEFHLKKNRLWLVFFFLILIENVPISLKKYKNFISPPKEITEYFKDEKKIKTILDLPSDLGIQFRNDYKDFFSYSREILYMNYQTYHHQNSLNGVNGYFPKTRLDIQVDINRFLATGAFNEKFKKINADYIVFHKNLILSLEESNLLPFLKRHPSLQKILETRDLAVFKILNFKNQGS